MLASESESSVGEGSFLGAALQYALSRRILRARIQRTLASRPSLAAIQRAVQGDEFRVQVLLRLTPLNAARIVNPDRHPSHLHSLVVFGGLLACITVMVVVARMARKALAEAVAKTDTSAVAKSPS